MDYRFRRDAAARSAGRPISFSRRFRSTFAAEDDPPPYCSATCSIGNSRDYRRPPNRQPLRSEFFHMVRFPDTRSRRRLVSVRINDPGTELRLAGDENLVKVHPTQLSPAELRLFEDSPGSLIFDAESAGDSLTATLEVASARYRADVFVGADVAAGGGIGHKLSLHCQPEASAVGSVLVRFARGRMLICGGARIWRRDAESDGCNGSPSRSEQRLRFRHLSAHSSAPAIVGL